MNALVPLLATVAAYVLGSLSFAVIVSRVMGLSDPRTYGSKNPGATNVLRSGSKAAAVLTLLLDALKGWLPVALVLGWGQPYGMAEGTAALVGLAAFAGHLWPVFFRFVGGKGVATAAGVLLAIDPTLGLLTLATWIVIAAALRYSSLAALVAAAASPLYAFFLWGSDVMLAAVGLIAMILIGKHWANLQRLMVGTEPKIGAKKKA